MDQTAPDLYTDAVQIGMSPFGVILSFAMQPPGQMGSTPPIKVCTLRMSLEHAKVMTMMLRKQIKSYEDNLGTEIPLHGQIWQQLGFSKQEDW